MSEIVSIDPSKVFPSPFNHERAKRYNQESLAELGRKMKMLGQIEPAIARPKPGGAEDEYELVVGERRWNGCKLEQMPLQLIVRPLTDREVCDVMVSENLDRENMSPVEEACVFADLLKARGADGALIYPTRESLCDVTGRKASTIEDRLKLLDAPEFLLRAIEDDKIAARVGEKIGRLHPSQREEAAKRAMHRLYGEGPMTVQEVEEMIGKDFQKSLRGSGINQADVELLSSEQMQQYGFRASPEPADDDGSCLRCRWRTGNDPALKGCLGGGGVGGGAGIAQDLCRLPDCLRAKIATTLRNEARAAEGAGGRTMPAEKAKRLLKGYDVDLGVYVVDGQKYVCLEHEPGYEHLGHFGGDDLPTWAELLEGVEKSPILIKDAKKRETRSYLESELAVELAEKRLKEDGKKSIFKAAMKTAEMVAAAKTPTPSPVPVSKTSESVVAPDVTSVQAEHDDKTKEKLRQLVLSELGNNIRNRGVSPTLIADLLEMQAFVAERQSLERALRFMEVPESEWQGDRNKRKLVCSALNEHRENDALAVLTLLLASEALELGLDGDVHRPSFGAIMDRHGVSVARMAESLGEGSGGVKDIEEPSKSVFAAGNSDFKRGRAMDDGVEFACDRCGGLTCLFDPEKIRQTDDLAPGTYFCPRCEKTPEEELDVSMWPEELRMMLDHTLIPTSANENDVFADASTFTLKLPGKAFAKIYLATDGEHFYAGYYRGIGGTGAGSGSSSCGAQVGCNFLRRVDAVTDWLCETRCYFAKGFGTYPGVDKIKRAAVKAIDVVIARIPEPYRPAVSAEMPPKAKAKMPVKPAKKSGRKSSQENGQEGGEDWTAGKRRCDG